MGIKARAEYTVSVVNDGKGEKTFVRYSDDGGKTFTESKELDKLNPVFEKKEMTTAVNKSKTNGVGVFAATVPLEKLKTGDVCVLSFDYWFDENADKGSFSIFSEKWQNAVDFNLNKTTWPTRVAFTFVLPNYAQDGNIFVLRLNNDAAVTEGVEGKVFMRNVQIVNADSLNGVNQFKIDRATFGNNTYQSLTTTSDFFMEKNLPHGVSTALHVETNGAGGGVFFGKENFIYPDTSMDMKFSVYMRSKTEGLKIHQHIEGNYAVTHTLTEEWERYEINASGSGIWHTLCLYTDRAGEYDVCCPQFGFPSKMMSDTWKPSVYEISAGTKTGKFIGIMSWDKDYPPLTTDAYTWSEFKGQDAEMYKLNPLEESAVVGEYGGCDITLRYEIRHVIGNKETKYTGNDVAISADSRVGELNFTKKSTGEWECMTTIVDFTKKQLGAFNINVMKGEQVLDTRVVPVTYDTNVLLEASQKLGEVVASVKGVSKLIHNMFVGSTFLEPIEGAWMMFGAAVDKEVKYNNSNAVLIQNSGAAQDSYHGAYFFIEGLVPQKKYTISVMVRTDNLKGMDEGAAIEIKMTDNGQEVRLCDPFPIVLTKENEWQKVEFTFTTPDRITSEKVQVRFQLWRNGHLWISQPMMNQGDVAAEYTANIKDIQLSLAQIKVTANTISQSITDLSTGIEQAGIHLDGANSEITLKADKTKYVDRDGKTEVFIKDGKLNAKAIDADKVVAEGIQSKTIDAKNATFENVNIKGGLDSVSGTFKRLKCVDGNGNVVAVLRFGEHGALTIEGGDLFMQGTKDGRSLRFYTSDIWCRGMFGHTARTCAVIKNDIMHVYVGGKGKDGEKGVKVKLSTAKLASGETVYRIPMYSPGTGYYADELFGTLVNSNDPKLSGVPIDVIVFNCTTNFLYTFVLLDKGKTWTVINGNNVQTVKIVDIGGWRELDGGTASNYFYVAPEWLYPYQSNTNKLGRGVFYAGSWDMNWT